VGRIDERPSDSLGLGQLQRLVYGGHTEYDIAVLEVAARTIDPGFDQRVQR
jgi:hypothetical protein